MLHKISLRGRLKLEFVRLYRAFKNNPWAPEIKDVFFVYRPFLFLYRFFYFIFSDFAQKKTLMVASSLSYATMLGIIPILLVVAALSKGLLAQNLTKLTPKIVDFLVYKIAPVFNAGEASGSDLHNHIEFYIRNQLIPTITTMDLNEIGIYGALVLIVISLSLLSTIEKAFNDIWGITVKRPIWKLILNYWLVMALFPIIMLVILWLTGFSMFSDILEIGQSFWFGKLITEQSGTFIAMWVLCTIIYIVIPNTRVKILPAAIGGIIGGSLWQLNNMLSFIFVSNAIRTHYIYGSVGLIPILLIALFFGWLIILLGAHISFAIQNLEYFRVKTLARHITPFDEQEISVMCMSIISKCFTEGKPPPSLEDIAEISGLPDMYLSNVLDMLQKCGFIIETSEIPSKYVLSLPPDALYLKHIMDRTIGQRPEKDIPLSSNKKLWREVTFMCDRYRNSFTPIANPSLTKIVEELEIEKHLLHPQNPR
ncbi:MAG TPA: hypothetical protein DD381_00550 [Lentisphaeria bacterium]|nr:MAG: hypothetical protein A2X47_04990 [Lentisphaerae bacterium GWF2_38_69]HBM14832.1 hypothetical protein [Lentisphaeria bacterium]